MSSYQLITKFVSDLTADEYEACHALNLGSRGRIRDELEWESERGKISPARVIMAVDQMGTLGGWALMFGSNADKCGLFVDPIYRRQGIGTMLVEECFNYCQRPTFFPDTLTRAEFFVNFEGRFSVPNDCRRNLRAVRHTVS